MFGQNLENSDHSAQLRSKATTMQYVCTIIVCSEYLRGAPRYSALDPPLRALLSRSPISFHTTTWKLEQRKDEGNFWHKNHLFCTAKASRGTFSNGLELIFSHSFWFKIINFILFFTGSQRGYREVVRYEYFVVTIPV